MKVSLEFDEFGNRLLRLESESGFDESWLVNNEGVKFELVDCDPKWILEEIKEEVGNKPNPIVRLKESLKKAEMSGDQGMVKEILKKIQKEAGL